MRLYRLSSKAAILLKNSAAEFIQHYSTNIPQAPRNAFVDLKGRIVVVFDQKLISPEVVLLVIEEQFQPRLEKHLSIYLSLTGTTFEKDPRLIYHSLEGGVPGAPGDIVIPQKQGFILVSSQTLASNVPDEEFRLFRLKQNLPVQGVDFDDPLLLTVADEEFVCYTKGCYLGQEIIARIHHRSKPPKKLVVLAEDEAPGPVHLTSRTRDPESGRTLGFAFVENP